MNIIAYEDALKEVGLKRHLAELWMKKFPLISLKKGNDGKMGFSSKDISLLKGVSYLMKQEQKTFSEVQTLFNQKGVSYISALGKEKFSKDLIIDNELSDTAYQDQNQSIKGKLKNIFHKTNFSRDVEHKKLSLPMINQTQDIVSVEDVPENTSNSSIREFEQSWKKFMQNQGRVETYQKVSSEISVEDDPSDFDFLVEEDIIDEIDPNLIEAYPSENKEKTIITSEQSQPYPEEDHYIEYIEKVKHVRAKLLLLKTELHATQEILKETVKVFGYAHFDESAFSRYEEKPAYY